MIMTNCLASDFEWKILSNDQKFIINGPSIVKIGNISENIMDIEKAEYFYLFERFKMILTSRDDIKKKYGVKEDFSYVVVYSPDYYDIYDYKDDKSFFDNIFKEISIKNSVFRSFADKITVSDTEDICKVCGNPGSSCTCLSKNKVIRELIKLQIKSGILK